MTEATTLPDESPRHADLVDERLVRWYFYAALTYLSISMLGGLLMALQLVQRESAQRHRAASRPAAGG